MPEHFPLRLVGSRMLAPSVRHLVFQRDDGSLTDDAVEQVVGEVLLTLGERIGARLRT